MSVGQKVAGCSTGHGRLDVMCQNPKNAIIHLGHSGGKRFCKQNNVQYRSMSLKQLKLMVIFMNNTKPGGNFCHILEK